ncbi:MAG: acyl-CoA dehydrogenase family protein, partial [Bryobacterales bacterium]|nr:acyl-CoA dehydrogenase family protein [Bryobacterales bacterium]
MPTHTSAEEPSARPLTQLSQEERMFQETVRRFAREQIQPHVRAMDEEAKFRPALLGQM